MKRLFGFTLIEALIALTITMILGAVTLQGMRTLLTHNLDESMQQSLQQFLLAARNQADMRHRTVTICASTDSKTCSDDWSDGQLMFVDDAEDGVIKDASQIITAHQMKSNHGHMHGRFYPRYRAYLQFHPAPSENNDDGTFWFCPRDAKNPAWALVLNKEGEVRSLKKAGDGSITGTKGKLLACSQSSPAALPAVV